MEIGDKVLVLEIDSLIPASSKGKILTIEETDIGHIGQQEYFLSDGFWHRTYNIRKVESGETKVESGGIKVGDTVRVINEGCTYSTYAEKFKELGFKNYYVNHFEEDMRLKNATVFGVTEHEFKYDGTLVAIRFPDKRELLINQKGVELVKVESVREEKLAKRNTKTELISSEIKSVRGGYRILLTQKDPVTQVVVFEDSFVTAIGEAKRMKADKADPVYGFRKALKRALEKSSLDKDCRTRIWRDFNASLDQIS